MRATLCTAFSRLSQHAPIELTSPEVMAPARGSTHKQRTSRIQAEIAELMSSKLIEARAAATATTQRSRNVAHGKSKFAEAFEAQEAAEQLAAERLRQHRDAREIEERRAGRLDHAEPAELYTKAGIKSARLHNLSVSGALVKQCDGELLEINDLVSLRLLDGRHILARIIRVEERYLGLRFDDQLGSLEEITHLEARGPSFYRTLAHRATGQPDTP